MRVAGTASAPPPFRHFITMKINLQLRAKGLIDDNDVQRTDSLLDAVEVSPSKLLEHKNDSQAEASTLSKPWCGRPDPDTPRTLWHDGSCLGEADNGASLPACGPSAPQRVHQTAHRPQPGLRPELQRARVQKAVNCSAGSCREEGDCSSQRSREASRSLTCGRRCPGLGYRRAPVALQPGNA